MKKYLTIGFLFFLAISCGTRKVQIDKSSENIKTDSTSKVVENEVLEAKNDIVSTNETDETEISPVDSSKAIVINGISYKNAIIRHKKSKVNTIDKTIKNTSKNTLKDVEVKRKVEKQIFVKKIEKQSFPFYWLLLLLIIPLYYLFKKYREKIWFI